LGYFFAQAERSLTNSAHPAPLVVSPASGVSTFFSVSTVDCGVGAESLRTSTGGVATFVTACLGGTVRGAAVLAVGFLATVLLAAVFPLVVFLAVTFLAVVFRAAVFLAADLLDAVFRFAAGVVRFAAVALRAGAARFLPPPALVTAFVLAGVFAFALLRAFFAI
jgi:hypothetical protein